jgi:hypothetical protein
MSSQIYAMWVATYTGARQQKNTAKKIIMATTFLFNFSL